MKPAYKPIPKDSCSLFRVERQETNQDFDYPWHYHPEYELTLILSRHGIRYVGNNIEHFFDHDLVLLGSNLPHTWINSAEEKEIPKAFVIFLNEEFINWLNNDQFPSIVQLFKRSNQGIKFSKEVALRVKAKLPELLEADPFEKCIILMQILKELASTEDFHLLSTYGFTNEFTPTKSERINAVYQYVSKNYGKRIYLEEVASHVNMSEENFSRFFSKTMMKSFFTFLNEYRIGSACKLLIETDKQISEICYKSGFESIPFFYKQFKKFMHCQPRTFRLNYQKATL
ncbi:MAG TPA: AraC family transcriptional regulator [Flavitalea sp.]|nr:AraC family transcriptional regulator [Flavitalea sp.]